jgi:hypothetical protein
MAFELLLMSRAGEKILDLDVPHAPVGVVDEKVGGAGLTGSLDGGVHLGHHEGSAALVLSSFGGGHLSMGDAADALHVDGDEDADRILSHCGRGQEQCEP